MSYFIARLKYYFKAINSFCHYSVNFLYFYLWDSQYVRIRTRAS